MDSSAGDGGKADDDVIGMLERVNYFVLSRGLPVDDAAAVDTLAAVLHTGIFGGRPARRAPTGRRGGR